MITCHQKCVDRRTRLQSKNVATPSKPGLMSCDYCSHRSIRKHSIRNLESRFLAVQHRGYCRKARWYPTITRTRVSARWPCSSTPTNTSVDYMPKCHDETTTLICSRTRSLPFAHSQDWVSTSKSRSCLATALKMKTRMRCRRECWRHQLQRRRMGTMQTVPVQQVLEAATQKRRR